VAPDTAAKPTVYVVIESEWKSGDVGGCLLLDTGEVKWSHMSSSRGWLQRDLTVGFTDRRTELERLYPNGYEVVVVDGDGQIPDDVIARNKAWGEAEKGGSVAPADPQVSTASEPTWHSEIMAAGLVGLHRATHLDAFYADHGDDHQDCRDIVYAVLTGLADAGYRVVKPALTPVDEP